MGIITISRELASLGDETAQELAKVLKWKLVGKSELSDRLESYGVSGEKLEKYDERKPGIMASLSQDRDEYLHYLKKAILTEAAEGNRIFVGRGSFLLFQDLPCILTVRLVSTEDVRIKRVKSYFHCDDKRARHIIQSSDDDRSGFHRYFFEADWRNSENYMVTLNTSSLAPQLCAKIIASMYENYATDADREESAARIKDMLLAQEVVDHVLYQRRIAVHFFDAAYAEGVTHVYGVAASKALAEAAVKAAAEVEGTGTIESEIQVVQDYTMLPQG
jgi:cytidylate kinase